MSTPLVLFLCFWSYAAGVGTRDIARCIRFHYLRQEIHMNPRRITARVTVRWVVTTIFGILAIAGGLALFLAFSFRQDVVECQTEFNDYDSMARQVRADAQVDQSKTLRDAIVSAGKLIDPAATPTLPEIHKARADLALFVEAADGYDDVVAKYPYKSFSEFCGGAQ